MRKIISLVVFFACLHAAHGQSLNPSFAQKGYTAFNFYIGNVYYETSGQVLRKSDGTYYVLFQVNGYALVSHYFANGDMDRNFGINGYSEMVSVYQAKGAVQPDGKIIIAGETFNPAIGSYDFGVARLTTNGFIDRTFAVNGIATVDFSNSDDLANSVVIQPDGKIVVGGETYDRTTGVSDFALARFNADGTPDHSFGDAGKQTTDFSGNADQIWAISLAPNGKIVAAGQTYSYEAGFYSMAVARYNTNGSLDKSFSGDGKQITSFSNQDSYVHGVVVQEDGKIVIAGQVGESFQDNSSVALVRYTTNGSLDNTFGGDGKVTADFFDSTDVATSIALQTDGKIVIGGYTYNPKADGEDFVVARFNTNGTLDKTFGKNGRTVTDFNSGRDEVNNIVIEPDGSILAAGEVFNTKADNYDYAVVRYNEDGKLDRKFGHAGTVSGYYEAGESRIDAVAVQDDGKIVVAGGANAGKTNFDFAVARFNANGTLDKSFGNDGKVLTDILGDDDEALDVAIQPDGKIVAAGRALNNTNYVDEFAIVRYNPDGSLDKKFGRKGVVSTNLPGYNNFFGGLVLQPNGKIIIAGALYNKAQNNSNFGLLRYTADGLPDYTFGGDGIVVTDFSTTSDEFATSVALQHDGKIVVSGYGFSDIHSDFLLARYNSDGTLDHSFNGDGKVITAFSSVAFAPKMVIQPDGKIILGGEYYHLDNDDYDYALARYNTDGSLDKSFSNDGKQVTDLNGTSNYAVALALQPDGKIVVLGDVTDKNTGHEAVGLTRYTANGALDKTFDGDGTLITHFVGFNNFPTDITIRDNKAYVSAYAFTPAEVSILASYILGPQNFAAPQVNSQAINESLVAPKAIATTLIVKAQPNPSSHYFTLLLQSGKNNSAMVSVRDAAGRLIETKNNVAANTTLQLGQTYTPGIYYAEIIQGNYRTVIILIKQ